MDFQQEFQSCCAAIETRLQTYFAQQCPQKELLDAMRYSLLAGGKRIRPVLALKFCELTGGGMEEALDFACGVEMLHTYSLIHDDLPCMDNDDLRRGKPTCHKQFGETIATLAGDALQAAAFQAVLSYGGADTAKAAAAMTLAQAAGANGMCGGQYLDMAGDVRTTEQLYAIHSAKTGAMLRAACVMGVLASSGYRSVPEEALRAAGEYADHLGIAFQIQDDILDVTATSEVLGKPVGSDEANQKVTFITLLGVSQCRELVYQHTALAKDALIQAFPQAHFLCRLADLLAERKH